MGGASRRGDRLFGAVRADEEHPAARDPAGEEMEEAHGALVRPLQVLDREHQRPLLRDERDDLVQHFPELLLAGRSVRCERESEEAAQDGNRSREPRRAVEQELLQRGRGIHAAEGEVLPQGLRER